MERERERESIAQCYKSQNNIYIQDSADKQNQGDSHWSLIFRKHQTPPNSRAEPQNDAIHFFIPTFRQRLINISSTIYISASGTVNRAGWYLDALQCCSETFLPVKHLWLRGRRSGYRHSSSSIPHPLPPPHPSLPLPPPSFTHMSTHVYIFVPFRGKLHNTCLYT